MNLIELMRTKSVYDKFRRKDWNNGEYCYFAYGTFYHVTFFAEDHKRIKIPDMLANDWSLAKP